MVHQPEPETARRGGKLSPPRARGRSWWGRLALLVLVPVVLYSLYVVAEKSLQTYRLRQDAALLQAEIAASKQENIRLQKELVEARTDQQIEDSARRYLNLIRPGDTPVVLVGLAPTPTATPPVAGRPVMTDDLPPWLTWIVSHLER